MGTGIVSPGHILILLVVVLLVFGAKRLPELGRSLGSGMREFKSSVTGDDAPPTLVGGAPQAEQRESAEPVPVITRPQAEQRESAEPVPVATRPHASE